jgi:hypothetical protein
MTTALTRQGRWNRTMYRAERIDEATWICVQGDDYMSAPIYDCQEDAEDAAAEMNGRYFADGRPANAAARAMQGGVK